MNERQKREPLTPSDNDDDGLIPSFVRGRRQRFERGQQYRRIAHDFQKLTSGSGRARNIETRCRSFIDARLWGTVALINDCALREDQRISNPASIVMSQLEIGHYGSTVHTSSRVVLPTH